jgi:prenyltransferase beta subunit
MTTTAAAAAIALALLAPKPEPPDVRPAVRKGLDWLAKQQGEDGSWRGMNDGLPTFVTGYAALALLMEGSTLQDGAYSSHLRKALAWMEKNARPDGLLGGTHQTESSWDTNGHAIGLLFLACAYDVDDNPERRLRVGKLLDRAVAFASDCQTPSGGWGYQSASQTSDDSFSTITMLHALVGARKAGIAVPKVTTQRAIDYLVKSTRPDGGVADRPMANDANTELNPLLAAGAAVGALMHDGRRPAELPRWVNSARAGASPVMQNLATNPIALFQQYHMARVAYALGESGHRKLEPAVRDAELVRWATYRATAFKPVADAQRDDGGWPEVFFGRAQTTAFALIVLQLDNDYLPAFSR